MAVTQLVSTDMPSNMVSLTHLVCNMLLTILKPQVVHQLISAETAHGHPLLKEKLELKDVGLLTTRSTMLLITTLLEVLTT